MAVHAPRPTPERGAATGRSRDKSTYSHDEREGDGQTCVCVCESLVTAKHWRWPCPPSDTSHEQRGLVTVIVICPD